MLAALVRAFDPSDPVSALRVEEVPDDRPADPDDTWTTVDVKAASLNRHDLWSLAGVGLGPEKLPMILGCDAAGTDENGHDVVVHAVINQPDWSGPELEDPGITIFSEHHQGTFAERVRVPRANLVAKPVELSFVEAACLPTAWVTAYRMLFGRSGLNPGDTVLVQGSGGGLATALIMLAKAGGFRTWTTGTSKETRSLAEELGADATFASGARLPTRVDAVMDSVGAATWDHSLKSLRRHGTMVVSGGTSGYRAQTEVARVFAHQLNIHGSSMGTRADLEALLKLMVRTRIRPPIGGTYRLADAREAFTKLATSSPAGKLVLTTDH